MPAEARGHPKLYAAPPQANEDYNIRSRQWLSGDSSSHPAKNAKIIRRSELTLVGRLRLSIWAADLSRLATSCPVAEPGRPHCFDGCLSMDAIRR